MPTYPSELNFAALLQYAPRGETAISRVSRDMTYKIKTDGYIGRTRVIAHAARRLAEQRRGSAFLSDYFGAEATVAPAPRSSPRRPGDLWPAARICEALLAEGLCRQVWRGLERTQVTPRAALAARGQRPNPPDHYASVRMSAAPLVGPVQSITLVDDVITRGSTFVGLVARLQEAYPALSIRCFALVRTISSGDIDAILDPVEGVISYLGGRLSRQP